LEEGTMAKKRMIRTFRELADALGVGETPARIGRSIYKGTSCGPWTAFLVLERPAQTLTGVAVIRRSPDNHAELNGWGRRNLGSTQLQMIGFAEDGSAYGEVGTWTFGKYKRVLRRFLSEGSGKHADYKIEVQYGRDEITLTVQWDEPQQTRDLSYEDKDAWEDPGGLWDRIVGLRIGSIVEGAGACASPVTVPFPCIAQDVWDAVEDVDEQCDEIWNNTHGCEKCGADGAINPSCTSCKGEGVVL